MSEIVRRGMPGGKTCTKCGEWKLLSEFYQAKDARCKECAKEYGRQARQRRKVIQIDEVGTKKCATCLRVRPLSCFAAYLDGSGTWASCKQCAAKGPPEKRRERYQQRKAAGICTYCDRPARPETTSCAVHAKEHLDFIQEKRRERRNAGLCTTCGKDRCTPNRKQCEACIKKRREEYPAYASTLAASRKARQRILRDAAYEAYGGYICACCGETTTVFLTLDHINNDGAEQRAKLRHKGGYHFYLWLKEMCYPPGLQVLCYNCNCGRQRNGGICPHKQFVDQQGGKNRAD